MPSPFPGMDPYLEGYLWPDVYHALASKIRQQLAPLLRPRYAARLAIYVVEDSSPEGDVGIMYPDVDVVLVGSSASSSPIGAPEPSGNSPISIPVLHPIEVQVVNVEIHDAADNRLVTYIEILSPINKREPGSVPYRQKRFRLYAAGVHLLEIDLLRRGTRPFAHRRVPNVPYAVALTRAGAKVTNVWPVAFRDALPGVPVPLQPPDDDVSLDLQAALAAIYDEAGYDLSIDYRQPPPPPALSQIDADWMHQILGRA